LRGAQILRLWKDVARDRSAAPWDEARAFGFFQRFRPNGNGLAPAILALPCGEELLRRLQRVYDATVDGWREDSLDAYFVVRRPQPSTYQELEELARRQMGIWLSIVRDCGNQELADELEVKSVEFMQDLPRPTHSDGDAPEVELHDVEGDWHGRLQSILEAGHVTNEAFYSIACDYGVARYLTWPWYRASTLIEEPYGPYFELWLRGAEISIPEAGRIVVGLGGHPPRRAA
jgi:hypothetical protein